MDEMENRIDAIADAVRNLSTYAPKVIEEQVNEALREMAAAKWEACIIGSQGGGINIMMYCKDYDGICPFDGFIPCGTFGELMAEEAEHVAEGDVGYGEKLRLSLLDALAKLDAALVEGRKHPFG